jgi:hypothetical protein
MFWVPQSGDIGIGVSILSYDDNVQFSLITDRHFIPDPETITLLFAAEVEKMMLALLMLDWEQPFDLAQVEQQLFGKALPPPGTAAPEATAVRTRRKAPGAPGARSAPGKLPTRAKSVSAASAPPAPAIRVPKRFRKLA